MTVATHEVEDSRRGWGLTAQARTVERWRSEAAAVVKAWGGDAAAVALVRLGVSELLSNVIKHVPDGRCRLLIQEDGGLVRVSVFDWARGVPAVRVVDADAECGRGLYMLRELVDDWGWTSAFVDGHLGKWVWFCVKADQAGRESAR